MKAFVIQKSDIDRCPKNSFSAGHYRPDGSCKCFRSAEHYEKVRERAIDRLRESEESCEES